MSIRNETKPGYLTTEFWLVIIANILTQAGALDIPDRWRWLITLATVTGYAIARGLAKTGVPELATTNLGDLQGDPSDTQGATDKPAVPFPQPPAQPPPATPQPVQPQPPAVT